MLLFKPEHVDMILSGRKWQTRRLWPKGRRCVPGSFHWAQTGRFDRGRFARLEILRVWQETLGDMVPLNALAEGYATKAEYIDVFNRINGPTSLLTMLWAVEFKVVREPVARDAPQEAM